MKSAKITVDFESSIAPWLSKTMKIVDYYIHKAMSDHNLDLTKEQMIVLKRLHDKDGIPQNELAFLTLRNKSSLTRLLVKMENKGYITRKQDKQDKRSNKVFLNDYGRKTYKKTRPVIQMIQLLQKIQFNLTSTKPSL